jgi:hypothetical protein
MDGFGNAFDSATGSVMSRDQLEEQRRKRGECITCGRKCFQKKLFKSIPITEHGLVLKGRCLNCHPLSSKDSASDGEDIPAVSRRATDEDLERFNLSQLNLGRSERSFGSTSRTAPAPSSFRSTQSPANRVIRQTMSGPMISPSSQSVSSHSGSSARMNGDEQSDGSFITRGPVRGVPRAFSTPVGIGAGTESSRPPHHHHLPSDLRNQIHNIQPSHSQDEIDMWMPSDLTQEQLDQIATEEALFMERQAQRVLNRGGAFVPHSPAASDGSGGRYSRSSRSLRVGSSRSIGSGISDDATSFTYAQSMLDVHVETDLEQHSESHHYDEEVPVAIHEVMSNQESDTAGVDQIENMGSDFVGILSIMRHYEGNTNVIFAGLRKLSQIHFSEEESNTLSHVGGIEVIVESMTAFASSADLQVYGCGAIWNATGIPQNQHAFVDAGAIDILLRNLEIFIENADLQEQALAALANLAALQLNVELMVERGVVRQVVNSMTKHSDDILILMKGCLVIANLSSHPSSMKRKIMDDGGGNALTIAMVMHSPSSELQEKALRGLRNLSANCDENKVEITNIGGIDATIAALQIHRDAVGVQEAGAWTLSNLAGIPGSCALIGECGGVDVLVRAMWVHADAVGVLEWCCRALFTLALQEKNSRLIVDVGGIAAIINAMQAHVDNSAVVQEMGCALLTNLAIDQTCKIRIVEEEGLDAIVLAMVLYSHQVEVQQHACEVLYELAIHENLKAMQASNVSELAQTASSNFPDQCGEICHKLLEQIETMVAHYG